MHTLNYWLLVVILFSCQKLCYSSENKGDSLENKGDSSGNKDSPGNGDSFLPLDEDFCIVEKPKFDNDLMKAVYTGNLELALSHISKGADVNYYSVDLDQTILMTAVLRNQPLVVELLLKHGARINDKNQQGQSALAISLESLHNTFDGAKIPRFIQFGLYTRSSVFTPGMSKEAEDEATKSMSITEMLIRHGAELGGQKYFNQGGLIFVRIIKLLIQPAYFHQLDGDVKEKLLNLLGFARLFFSTYQADTPQFKDYLEKIVGPIFEETFREFMKQCKDSQVDFEQELVHSAQLYIRARQNNQSIDELKLDRSLVGVFEIIFGYMLEPWSFKGCSIM